MNPPLEPRLRQRRYRVRRQARLDVDTRAKLEELARTFRRKRAAILRFVMSWGFTHGRAWTIDCSSPTASRPVNMLMDPELLQQVQDAVEAHGVTFAAWLCEAIRQVTPEDFPASWRVEAKASRSHESGYDGPKIGMGLDKVTAAKLAALTKALHHPAAEIMRQLIA